MKSISQFHWLKTSIRSVIVTVALLLQSNLAHSENIVLLVHKDSVISEISNEDVANIFLGIGNFGLKPYDQQDRRLRTEFYKKTANLSLASVRAHWAKRVFTGRGRPPPIINLQQIESVLNESTLTITYAPASQTVPGSKILLTLEIGEQP